MGLISTVTGFVSQTTGGYSRIDPQDGNGNYSPVIAMVATGLSLAYVGNTGGQSLVAITVTNPSSNSIVGQSSTGLAPPYGTGSTPVVLLATGSSSSVGWGQITNSQISNVAGISPAKIASGTTGQMLGIVGGSTAWVSPNSYISGLTGGQLSSSAGITGGQLSSSAGITGGQISGSANIPASALAVGAVNTVLVGTGSTNFFSPAPTITSLNASSCVAAGPYASVAQSGGFRVANNVSLSGRNTGNTADVQMMILDTNNNIEIGGGTLTVSPGSFASFGTTAAQSGLIRIPNAMSITARNAANTADVAVLVVNAGNVISIGSGELAITPGVSVNVAGTLNIGASLYASTGAINLTNAAYIAAENAAGNAGISLIGLDANNQTELAGGATSFGRYAGDSTTTEFNGIRNLTTSNNNPIATTWCDTAALNGQALANGGGGRVVFELASTTSGGSPYVPTMGRWSAAFLRSSGSGYVFETTPTVERAMAVSTISSTPTISFVSTSKIQTSFTPSSVITTTWIMRVYVIMGNGS